MLQCNCLIVSGVLQVTHILESTQYLQSTCFIVDFKNMSCTYSVLCSLFLAKTCLVVCKMHVRIGYLHLIYGSYYKARPCFFWVFFASLIISPMHLLVSCYKQLLQTAHHKNTCKYMAVFWIY